MGLLGHVTSSSDLYTCYTENARGLQGDITISSDLYIRVLWSWGCKGQQVLVPKGWGCRVRKVLVEHAPSKTREDFTSSYPNYL